MKFHKFTNNSFRMIIFDPCFFKKEKVKAVINRVLSTKRIVLVVHVTLVKPNVMQKLDEMNIITQLKVQNHQNTFETTSITILHGLSFLMLQKMLRAGTT